MAVTGAERASKGIPSGGSHAWGGGRRGWDEFGFRRAELLRTEPDSSGSAVRFVNEARRVLVDLSSIDGPGTEVEGGLLVISTAAARADGDGLRNAGEFTTPRHPLRRDGGVLNVMMVRGGLRAWLDFNRFQSEYVVAFDVSTDLQSWDRSAIAPTLGESFPEHDLIEAVFPPSEFSDGPFGAVRAVFEPTP